MILEFLLDYFVTIEKLKGQVSILEKNAHLVSCPFLLFQKLVYNCRFEAINSRPILLNFPIVSYAGI